jgi:hypothetical protein
MNGRRHAAISPLFHVQDRQVQVSRADHSNAIGSQKLSGLPYRGQVGLRRPAIMTAIKAFPSVPHPA